MERDSKEKATVAAHCGGLRGAGTCLSPAEVEDVLTSADCTALEIARQNEKSWRYRNIDTIGARTASDPIAQHIFAGPEVSKWSRSMTSSKR